MTDSNARPVLVVDRLRKSFRTAGGAVSAVDDVSFDLAASDFVALHGPSGCGKTTLLLVTGGLLSPDDGTIAIEGENPYAMDANRRAAFRAEHIGFVFQQFHLIPFLDVLDNVLVGELAGANSHTSLRVHAIELLRKFNLEHRLHHVPSALSVGEQQRVALARALVRRPRLLLADEPTGNLDSENAAIILEHLAGFASDGGAVLMVTHDDTARSAAGRALRIDAGKITATT